MSKVVFLSQCTKCWYIGHWGFEDCPNCGHRKAKSPPPKAALKKAGLDDEGCVEDPSKYSEWKKKYPEVAVRG